MAANGDLAGHVASQLGKAVRDGTGWKCKCPTHDDHDPSLGLSVDEDGKLLWFCRARKCSQQQVGDELKRRGLLPEREPRQPRPAKPVRDKLEGIHVYHRRGRRDRFRVHRWRKPDGSKDHAAVPPRRQRRLDQGHQGRAPRRALPPARAARRPA
jgi:hypothetical protein